MKRLILLAALAFCCVAASAVPANRDKFTYTQPDGSTIVLQLHGDEFCHWTTNAAGQVVELDKNGYYRPVSEASHKARILAGSINRSAANASRRGPRKASAAQGEKHFLVILVQFSDLSFQDGNNLEAINNLMNGDKVGSALDYFRDNSHGAFVPVFDVYGPVTLSQTQAYYGGNNSKGSDLHPREAIKEACQLLHDDPNSGLNFSQYDNDGDGEVDLVFMYYAGRGEADGGDANCIWPHQWNITGIDDNLVLDGKKVSGYACTNELTLRNEELVLCGIGTACHEFSHAIGLPDVYDTDYDKVGEEPEAGGLYWYSVMGYGSYLNSGRRPPYLTIEERMLLGWLDESALHEIPASGQYTLETVNNGIAYKTLTDNEGEYFVYECRSRTGWDRSLPEKGLIVYHVDKSSYQVKLYKSNGTPYYKAASELWSNWNDDNALNANGLHPCYYVVPAGDVNSLNYTKDHPDIYHFAFPGEAGATAFTAVSWNGVESDVKLSNIRYSDSDLRVTFYAYVPSAALNYNVIANPGNGVYSAGSSFNLNLIESPAQPVSSVQWFFDDEPVSASSVILPAGTHVVEAHLTLASGELKILELTLTAQ